ncbi:MAG TPA: DUF4180 domain-containing protein [Longimicrobium sp.]|nr:DUF4180 domain-containing protein [Longimicrobium sp.]
MSYFELPSPPAGAFDPSAAVVACIESGERALLADEGALPPAFFDLSTGVAGAMVQKLTQYGLRMAVVVPDPSVHSGPFQDFAHEASRSATFRFFPDRASAVAWLEAG